METIFKIPLGRAQAASLKCQSGIGLRLLAETNFSASARFGDARIIPNYFALFFG
jgi:hypothetical protein